MALSKLSYKLTPRYGHVAVAIGHRQFTWGGYTGDLDKSKESTRIMEVFGLSNEQWEKRLTRGSPPPGYAFTAYTTIGTTLYSFGGFDGRSSYNSLHRLDLSSLEWEEVVPRNPSAAPQRKSSCQMVSFQDNKLVVFAGYTDLDQYLSDQLTDELHVFNVQEGTWSSPPTTGDKPSPCCNFTLTKIDDHHAVMFGGFTRWCSHNGVFILELGKWHWTELLVSDPKPPVRSSHAACCLAGPLTGQEHPMLMVVGGKDDRGTLNDGWILDVGQRRWTKLDFPGDMQPLFHRTVTVFGSALDFRQMVLYGGIPSHFADPVTATTLLNLELECGVWRVTGVILEDQLGKWPEEKLRERMEKLWPSTQQTYRAVRLAQLKLMKAPKGGKVEVIKSLAANWRAFGVHLDFDPDGTTLNVIGMKHPLDPEACCQEMFEKWLAGSGRRPATWELLIELLEDDEQRHLAGQIKQALGL